MRVTSTHVVGEAHLKWAVGANRERCRPLSPLGPRCVSVSATHLHDKDGYGTGVSSLA
jgi:hypothetical protein